MRGLKPSEKALSPTKGKRYNGVWVCGSQEALREFGDENLICDKSRQAFLTYITNDKFPVDYLSKQTIHLLGGRECVTVTFIKRNRHKVEIFAVDYGARKKYRDYLKKILWFIPIVARFFRSFDSGGD